MRNGGFIIYKKEADKKDFRPIGSVGINARFFGACIRRISYCAADVHRIEHDVYKKSSSSCFAAELRGFCSGSLVLIALCGPPKLK